VRPGDGAIKIRPMSLVIDVHTHMLHREWLALLKQHGGPGYSVAQVGEVPEVIHWTARLS